jgi:hypothetical protein
MDVISASARILRRPLPFAGPSGRHTVGARAVPLGGWLELTGDDVAGQVQEKQRLFDTRRGDVLRSLPGSEAAKDELLEAVRQATGARVEMDGLDPLEAAGRLAPEDFCLHLPDPVTGELALRAACVCFPNRWLLESKIGRNVTAIHSPVPGYQEQLGSPVSRLMERLAPDRIMERHNWGIADGPELFAPEPRSPGGSSPDYWLRVERQTLRRLPRSGAVVFTIRTLQAPLAVVRHDPDASQLLATAIRALPDSLALYKLGSAATRADLADYLSSPYR